MRSGRYLKSKGKYQDDSRGAVWRFTGKRKYLSKNCDAEITDGEGLIVKYVILCPEGHKMAEFMIDNRDSQVG